VILEVTKFMWFAYNNDKVFTEKVCSEPLVMLPFGVGGDDLGGRGVRLGIIWSLEEHVVILE
jgi:hypothetical protein